MEQLRLSWPLACWVFGTVGLEIFVTLGIWVGSVKDDQETRLSFHINEKRLKMVTA